MAMMTPATENRADAVGGVTAASFANQVVEFHREGLGAKRLLDLTAEKYAIHLDGEGDGQYADILYNSRVEITGPLGGQLRHQENLLRPIVANAVAYHTTMPFHFMVEPKPDREAKQRAVIDQGVLNHIARQQRWNAAIAEAFEIACVYGHCPIHQFWRHDIRYEPYDPIYGGMAADIQQQQGMGPGMGPQQTMQRGFVDIVVGDPWDTVYNPGARRNSRHVMTWGKTFPLQVVRTAFPDIDLQGSDRIPSSARWQRIRRQWKLSGMEVHGGTTLEGYRSSEDMIAVVCRELAPGIDTNYPEGRMTLVAVQGVATVSRTDTLSGAGQAVLLHDGPLPAGRMSSIPLYSLNRYDDIHGKPFVGDLDDLQVQLNLAVSARAEYLRRAIKPPLVQEGVVQDSAAYVEDGQIEVEPGSQIQPYFLTMQVDAPTLNTHIQDLRQAMYTIGGYQAASRGEAHSGDSGSKVRFLAEADDTVHGPVNQRVRETVEDLAGLAHALFREYADVPWLLDNVGSEINHMAEAWVDRSMVSPEDPQFRLVSGFGSTMASKTNLLVDLVTTAGADGQPLMTTRQFQAAWPDASTYPEKTDPIEVLERRAQMINGKIRRFARQMEEQLQNEVMRPELLFMQHVKFSQSYPVLPDDDPMISFTVLSEVTQDETESPVARKLAAYRQGAYHNALVAMGMKLPGIVPPADPEADLQGKPAQWKVAPPMPPEEEPGGASSGSRGQPRSAGSERRPAGRS